MIDYFKSWGLTDPQLIAQTETSQIMKVRVDGDFAVLKLLTEVGRQHEGSAPLVLQYFDGMGAVRVLRSDEGAHLLEYLAGPTLQTLSLAGHDFQAADVICDVVSKLHAVRANSFPALKSLDENFHSLHLRASMPDADPMFITASRLAEKLLSQTSEPVVLHGDLHHQNILGSHSRGWIAIDPHGVIGDRHFDLANCFFNPSGEQFASIDRALGYAQIFSARLGLDRRRLLEFAFAGGCLRASWELEDGKDPKRSLQISRAIQSLL